MASLGQELKQEREKRGISLEEISRATRISLRFLHAVEADNFHLVPGGFFIRAVLRAYANYVGLEDKAVLERYEALCPQKEELPRKKEPDILARRHLFTRISVTILILAIGLAISYWLFRPRGEKNQIVSRSAIIQEPLPTPILPPKPAEETTAPAPITELHLEISFHQRTWIQVYADGILKLDGIKGPGTTFETTASKELLLHLGNAGGMTYSLNGLKGKALGRPGAVVKNIRITLENLKDFVESQSDSIPESPAGLTDSIQP
jgi:transcriptional regulator with XRE-family HTH domain